MDDLDKAAGNSRGSSRRKLLKCMTWAGAGLVWTVSGGIPRLTQLGAGQAMAATGDFTFVQISDTHIGFNKPANPDVTGTAKAAVELINTSAPDAGLVIHTGDVTHLSKPEEFEAAAGILNVLKASEIHVTPGEHDVLDDTQSAFFDRYGKPSGGKGWYSFDKGGVHFICLMNVLDFKAGGQGRLGPDQIAWLASDLKARSASHPLVLFTHIPLWSLQPTWGWSTEDWPQAMTHLKRFGSVTILNGHIHQVVQKVEGKVHYHSARSTAYPQPVAGQGPGPGPLTVPAEQLRSVLGIRRVDIVATHRLPAITDHTLADG
ncbi:MAG: metallophosphoesterase [Rhodospirillaceae bacterium]|nr:MAG: metallophosphoesterase [Rhodospirillaceae bacterium]